MSETLVVVAVKSDTELQKFLKLHEMADLIGGPVGAALLRLLGEQHSGVVDRWELDDADD